MPIILENALLADLDPITVEAGALRIAEGMIVERGDAVTRQPGDEVIDCNGAVVLPGLVNGHTHLYSALAAGMPAPPKSPKNFHEVLQYVWWRLDRALEPASNEMSARIGALDALRCGTTTLIDHHASPDAIEGSLDQIEAGIAAVGLRGVLCYEVTDRNGRAGRDQGLKENQRYITKTRDGKQFAGLVGAHASFTLENETMAALDELSRELGRGVHIHVAEDPCDEQHSMKHHDLFLLDRLDQFDLLRTGSLFAHCIHLHKDHYARLAEAGVSMAHNTRSNMNNSVGYAPIGSIDCAIQLGTDGIGADMFTEAKTAWFKSCDAKQGIAPARVVAMLAASARRASADLGITLGQLRPGAAADVVITDYIPATPLTKENFAGHFIFAMGSHHVKHVIAGGTVALRNRQVEGCDEAETRRASVPVARRLWERMG
jgi:putative selenium metabolism protein SsnA